MSGPGTLLPVAQKYAEAGFSVLPIRADGSKAPAVAAWKQFQTHQPSPDELRAAFGNGARVGIALVHGAISGNSEVLDFDKPGLIEEYAALCDDHGLTDLLASLPLIETPSGGRHLPYRCEEPVEGNQKLARRAVPVEAAGRADEAMKEAGAHPDGRGGWYELEVLIETRGEGGYTVAPGSPLTCHPDGKPYRKLRGDLAAVPVITGEQRRALLAMARALNEYTEPERVHRPATGTAKASERASSDGLRPGDDFNERGDPLPLLEAAGWRVLRNHGHGVTLRRPGKNAGVSATWNFNGHRHLRVFTTSASPFEEETSYPAFSIYGLLKCGGDFAEAARQLGREGYGDQAPPAVKRAAKYAPINEAPPPSDADAPPFPSKSASEVFFKLTDLGNAERLIHRHGPNLRYSPALGWLVWDGHRWQRDESGQVMRWMKHTVRLIYGEAAAVNQQAAALPVSEDEKDPNRAKAAQLAKVAAAIAEWAKQSEATPRLKAAVESAKTEPGVYVPMDELDRDAWLLNCPNGTLDLRTGGLRPHRQEDMLTKQALAEYDPAATAPQWETFLSRILPDEKVRLYLQRVVGYALTADVSEQSLFFLFGSGSNGKSTLLKTLLLMLGDYAKQAHSELLVAKKGDSIPNDVAELQGRRFVATIETEEGKKMAESLMKQLTGGDKITARFMRQDFFSFDPTFKILLAANHRPVVGNNDHALWRRIKLIPFAETISDAEKDSHLDKKLNAELPGILAWAVQGCLDWQKSDLGEPPAVTAGTDAYRAESDLLGQFIEECCAQGEGCTASASSLYGAYKVWCEAAGERAKTQRTFGAGLTERGFDRYKKSGIWYLGIRLRDERDELDEKEGSSLHEQSLKSTNPKTPNNHPVRPETPPPPDADAEPEFEEGVIGDDDDAE